MIEMCDELFEGYQCMRLENQQLSLWITKDVGPRIIGLSFDGGDNLMAVLPEAIIPVDGANDYSLRGGHRLWYGPEKPETTYIADDQPLEISQINNGLQLIQNVDQTTGIQKSWQVVLDDEDAVLTINHSLTNLGQVDFELAPWAITQLRKGGIAILPLHSELEDAHGLQPNRQIVFWPYTEINSPPLHLKNKAIYIEANLTEGAVKIGAPNPIGWLAYVIDKMLFVKKATYHKDATYLDRGASSQIYCNKDFIELETLGPVVNLAPGESVDHKEIWQIYPEGDWPGEIEQVLDLFFD